MPFEPGQRAGDYEVLEIIGKGGMGRVYRVRNVISNRIEAMKVLLSDLAWEPELGERFLSEIRILARLDHPNIAKFYTALQLENQLVMMMEYVEGISLADAVRQGPVPLHQILSNVSETLSALSYAHKNGVIHRDIKPSNVMITSQGIAKLMDFGIAKSALDPALTRPGTTMGSMLYMSPEQVRGEQVSARSDIYSIGVVLYELTAGCRPFEAENTFALLEAQLNAAPKPPIELNPALDPALNEIILTAMQKDPALRFGNADAFRQALESVRTVAKPSAAVQPTLPMLNYKFAKPSTAHRAAWMTAGALVCVCVLLAAAITLPHFSKRFAASPREHIQKLEIPRVSRVPTPVISKPAAPEQPSPEHHVRANRAPEQNRPRLAPPVYEQSISHETVPGANEPNAGPRVTTITPGPSQAELDKADEEFMKLKSRADAVRSGLDTLRAQQAASGLGLRGDVASSASRMENYLLASDRALQSKNLDNARKYMDSAEAEISKLESFFGHY